MVGAKRTAFMDPAFRKADKNLSIQTCRVWFA